MSQILHTPPSRIAPEDIAPKDISEAIARAHDLRSQAFWAALTRVFGTGRRIIQRWSRGTRSEGRGRQARC